MLSCLPDGENIGGEGEAGGVVEEVSPLVAAHRLQVARCLELLAVEEQQALLRPHLHAGLEKTRV